MTQQDRKSTGVPAFCAVVLLSFALILIFPASREIFRGLSAEHPFSMGFVKFVFLATVGELIAARISNGLWLLPPKILARALIWGLIGAVLAFMLKIYSGGVKVALAAGVLPGAESLFLKALLTSAVMNITFGPVMMGFHKMTDKYLELKARGAGQLDVKAVARATDWEGFISFVVLRTIPIFWIPAHTITFMLPAEYQTMMAAALSIALGIILSLREKPNATEPS
ncbi:hypothetical protein [Desulfotomaculum defluvii]